MTKTYFHVLVVFVLFGSLFAGCGPKSPSRPITKGIQSTLSNPSNTNFHKLIICRPWKFVNSGVYSAFLIDDVPAANFKSGCASFAVKPGKHFVIAHITDYDRSKWGEGIVVETQKDKPTIVVFNGALRNYMEVPDFPYQDLTPYQPDNPVIAKDHVTDEDLKTAARLEQKKSLEQAQIEAYEKQITEYVRKKDYSALKIYVNQNPRAAYFIPDDAMRLLFIGPPKFQVGDIITYKKKNISDVLLTAKIKSSKTPYKQFTMDEIQILQEYNISDALIAAMIDVTTEIEKEMARDEKQRQYLEAQRAFVRQKDETAQNGSSLSSDLGHELSHEISKQMVKGILDQLF